VNLHPDDLLSFIKLTALLLETRNFASYSNVCHEALQRFASTQDRTIARRLSKSCLLAPLPGGDIKLAAKLARFAGEGPLEEKSARQARFGTGLADFREGRFDAALVCLNSMTNLPASPEPIRVQFRAANDAVAAMCQYHLGQTNTARTTLAHATEASKLEWSKIGIDDLGANWQDTLIAHILLREADSAPAR
jgi:hypothetical protein